MNYKHFEIIYKTYFQPLYLYALRIVKNEEAAEDIIQEVFTECWTRRKKIDMSSSLKPYLYKIVYNRSLDYLKSSENKNINLSKDLSFIDNLFYTTFTQDDELHTDEISKAINSCITNLPPKCKEVFLLSRQHQMKNREIAEKLGINMKTVEKHISKALQELRNYLKQHGHLISVCLVYISHLLHI